MPGMLAAVRACFDRVPDPLRTRGISLSDCLMSGLAAFSFKMPSLLQFDARVRGGEDPVRARNLRTLSGAARAPPDTRMRERLDGADPRDLRRRFTRIHAALQRGKVLEGWSVLDGHLPVSVDGTGRHSSRKAGCRNRCARNRRDGSKTCRHQALGAAAVHPDHAKVLPLAPEPVRKEDGARKNDCERNAAKRLLNDLRREHPHMKAIIVEDAPASNGPHARLPKERDFRFVPGAKPGDRELPSGRSGAGDAKQAWERRDRKTGTVHRFEWDHGLPTDDANLDLRISMLHCEEADTNGNGKRFSRAADLPTGRDTAMPVMRAARRGRAIEDGTFQTLKAQDACRFEHSLGHGNNRLADVFATLAMPAFPAGQVQQHCCQVFRKAREHQGRNPASGTGFGNWSGHSPSRTGRSPAARSRGSWARRTALP